MFRQAEDASVVKANAFDNPIAVKETVKPAATDGAAGVTAIETSVEEVTVSKVDPLKLPEVAMIMLDPWAIAVAVPLVVIVAAFGF